MPIDRAKAIRYGVIAGVALLVLIVLGSAVSSYNSLVNQEEAATAQGEQVDVQYQRGFALLPRIESFAQDFLENETDLQAKIAALRSGLSGAQSGDLDDKEAYTQELDETLVLLTGRVENYPELKSGEIYQDLIAETTNTFNKIAFEKGLYNEKAQAYNAHLRECCVPVLVGKLFGFQRADYIGYSDSEYQTTRPAGEP
jgi:LemA protein